MITHIVNQHSQPSCPSCRAILRKKPARKTKCPSCGKDIFVRSTQNIFPSTYLTEDDAKAVDWLKKLEMFEIVDNEFLNKRKQLSEKFHIQAKSSDVIWGLFNDLLIKNGNDEQTMSMIYYDMALFLNQEGKDYQSPLRQAVKMKLLSLKKEGGVEKVGISCGGEGSCNECNQLDGKIFPIEDALKKMLLPFGKCTNSIEHGNPGFCMCIYLPIL